MKTRDAQAYLLLTLWLAAWGLWLVTWPFGKVHEVAERWANLR